MEFGPDVRCTGTVILLPVMLYCILLVILRHFYQGILLVKMGKFQYIYSRLDYCSRYNCSEMWVFRMDSTSAMKS